MSLAPVGWRSAIPRAKGATKRGRGLLSQANMRPHSTPTQSSRGSITPSGAGRHSTPNLTLGVCSQAVTEEKRITQRQVAALILNAQQEPITDLPNLSLKDTMRAQKNAETRSVVPDLVSIFLLVYCQCQCCGVYEGC